MVESEWAAWRGEFAKACDGSHHTIESIEAEIARGDLLPLYVEGGCYLVQIQSYPTESACQIMWAAGDLDTLTQKLRFVEHWAKERGCTEMLVEGHPAWRRVLKPQDYRQWSVTLRKALR